MSQKELFRRVALERLSSPEQLDQLLQVTPRRSWLLLVAVLVIVCAALLWSLTARLTVKLTGEGIFLSGEGISELPTPVTGKLLKLHIPPNGRIKRNQPLATFQLSAPTPSAPETSPTTRRSASTSQPATSRSAGGTSRDAPKPTMHKKPAKGKVPVERAPRRYVFLSPYEGQLVEYLARPGDMMPEGSILLRFERFRSARPKLHALLFLSPRKGKQLRPGMPVELLPATQNRAKYGYLYGKVRHISAFPLSRRALQAHLRHEGLVRMFSQEHSPTAVYVDLIADKKAPSGYRWSLMGGPRRELRSGTLCAARITVASYSPFYALFAPSKP